MSNQNVVRRVFSHTMRLAVPPSRVFPLLCPVREHEWIDGWSCELVHTQSGVAELGCVFRTAGPEAGSHELWVTSRYEPSRYIDFVRVLDERRVIHYEITLGEQHDGTTSARWSQVHLGYGEEGRRLVEQTPADELSRRMALVEKALGHFLETGQMLRRSR